MAVKRCKHYTGQDNRTCKQGIAYSTFQEPDKALFRSLPCLRDEVPKACDRKEPEEDFPEEVTNPRRSSTGITWWCDTCDAKREMTVEQFKAHMKDVHHIEELKGTRQMTAHMDGRASYTSNYRWDIGGVNCFQSVTNRRGKNDPMRY